MAFFPPEQISLTSPVAIISSAILLALFWVLALVTYRLYFSPLSHIPGPPLAAVTILYEFYFECILGGKYGLEIQKMHDRYGVLQICSAQSY